jgi:Fe-S-cluster containining protein
MLSREPDFHRREENERHEIKRRQEKMVERFSDEVEEKCPGRRRKRHMAPSYEEQIYIRVYADLQESEKLAIDNRRNGEVLPRQNAPGNRRSRGE